MKTVIEKFFTEDFVEINNVDGHKIILKTSFIAYIAEDIKNRIAYIHLSTGKTITVNLMNMPPLNDYGKSVYNNSPPPTCEEI